MKSLLDSVPTDLKGKLTLALLKEIQGNQSEGGSFNLPQAAGGHGGGTTEKVSSTETATGTTLEHAPMKMPEGDELISTLFGSMDTFKRVVLGGGPDGKSLVVKD